MKFKLFALLLITAFIKCDTKLTEAQKIALARKTQQQSVKPHAQTQSFEWGDLGDVIILSQSY